MLCLLGVESLGLGAELSLHLGGLDRKAPELLGLHADAALGLFELVSESLELSPEARLVTLVLLNDLHGLHVLLFARLKSLSESLNLIL